MTIDPNIYLIVIDSFCGAGGVTEGFHRAEVKRKKAVKVIIGINHDANAIASHAENHPDTHHFVEDFTKLDPRRLIAIVEKARMMYPNAKVMFWASAECTHHSKAKGGLPRNAASRSLPEHIERYVAVLNPDIIGVENVREFMDWGPLYESGKPIKELKKTYFEQWKRSLTQHGYYYDDALLNAADFGAYTSRLRYFGIFSKDPANIAFPSPTHSKTGANGLPRWRAVKDVLDLDKDGESIFARKKPLVDATLLRIIAGVEQFAIREKHHFLVKYKKTCKCPVVSCQGRLAIAKMQFASVAFSGRPKDKNFRLDRPSMTVTTKDHHQLFTTKHLMSYCFKGYNRSLNEPCGTVVTKDQFALISSKFIQSYYSRGGKTASVRHPATLTTVPKQRIVSCLFMDQQYGQSKPVSVSTPSGALTTNPKLNLVKAKWLMDTSFSNVGTTLDRPCKTITANRKHFYLMNPQFASKGSSIEKPYFTLIARMDKMPPYLMQTVEGNVKIRINPEDTPTMVHLKNLCNDNGIIDILMRMLFIEELKRIMGFGDDYILKGTKAEMKKFIGNAVECTQAKVLAEAICTTISESLIQKAV